MREMARVLLVEDEPRDLSYLRSVVEGAGHEVHCASDGDEAYKIEIVITDLHMPRVDGGEFIYAIRSLFPDARIIVVSGKGPEMLTEAEEKGAFVAFSKPVDPHALLEAVAQAVRDDDP